MLEVGKPNVVNDLLKRVPGPIPAKILEAKTPEPQDAEEVLAEEVLAEEVLAGEVLAGEVLAGELKANIDYLIMAWKKGDKKRIMFRVGQVARQFVELGRMCASFPQDTH